MEFSRQRFDILTDTGGDFTDTGPPFSGAIIQMYYQIPVGDTGMPDTGADLTLTLVNTGQQIMKADNIGEASFAKVPSQKVHDTGGAEISAQPAPIYAAHDQIRLTLNQSAGVPGQKAATVYITTAK